VLKERDSLEKQTKRKHVTYQEAYRPQIHFTPERNWMNDPNGMVYYEGEYHLFYQYHPDGLQWGPMHWGHAVSKDMLHWEHLQVALEPDELGMVFSGSAVVDWHDTTGFFNGGHGLVAIYTSAGKQAQQQSIAYSLDKGRTWITYEGNPVIPNLEFKDFRDPKVMWHEETKQWVMVLAAGQEVMLYHSQDLKDWTYVSSFGAGEGAHGGVWECPDVFELPVCGGEKGETRWVLQVDIGDGAVAGGSGGQYFVGHFDGKTFVNESGPGQIRWVDYGSDFYATQSFSDIPNEDGRRIWLAWMSNWKYANEVPTNPWRSAMSIPREVSLKKEENGEIHLIQRPIREIYSLEKDLFVDDSFSISESESKVITSQPDAPLILEVEAAIPKGNIGGLCLFQTDTEQGCVISIDRLNGEAAVDRTGMENSHFHEWFPVKTIAPIQVEGNKVKLTIIVDKGSVEVFADDGKVSITNLVLPKQESGYFISCFSERGEMEVKLEGKRLTSVW
jgi:fructan beta-fructosidase